MLKEVGEAVLGALEDLPSKTKMQSTFQFHDETVHKNSSVEFKNTRLISVSSV